MPPRKPILVNKKPIPTKKTVKILGITLDRSLTFRNHFAKVKEECKNRVSMMKCISKRRTRSDRRIRLRVADAVIGSQLLYGVELTSRAFVDLVKILSPTYNNSIRAISCLLPSTPADAACVEAGVLPFRYKAAMAIGSRAIGYLERTEDDGSVCFLEEQANRALDTVAGTTLPPVAGRHRIGPRSWAAKEPRIDSYLKDRLRKGANPSQAKALFQQRVNDRYRYIEVRYTDGSKMAERVGVGVHGREMEESYSLPDSCSVFSAEAAAISCAVARPSDVPILIATDSASVLSALKSPTNNHPFVQETQELLDSVQTNVTFIWVPGHCNIQGNEQADLLARIGRDSRRLTSKIPGDDVKTFIKNRVRNAWSLEWHRNLALFCRKIKTETTPWNDLPDWREQVVLSRLRTGHTRASHDMGGGSDFRKTCSSCCMRNTVEHMICNCPALEELRRTHDITDICRALQNDKISERQLINFLKDAKLFDEI